MSMTEQKIECEIAEVQLCIVGIILGILGYVICIGLPIFFIVVGIIRASALAWITGACILGGIISLSIVNYVTERHVRAKHKTPAQPKQEE